MNNDLIFRLTQNEISRNVANRLNRRFNNVKVKTYINDLYDSAIISVKLYRTLSIDVKVTLKDNILPVIEEEVEQKLLKKLRGFKRILEYIV